MTGRLRGVATQIRARNLAALSVHCFSHCLNLCLQDVVKSCTIVRDALFLVGDIANFVRNSPKRLAAFNLLKNANSPFRPSIRPLCPTRWTVRSGAINSILSNYEVLLQFFEEISRTSHDEVGSKAAGIYCQLVKFKSFFGLRLCSMIFGRTGELSKTLQSGKISLAGAMENVRFTTEFLKKQRNDEMFDDFFAAVQHEASKNSRGPDLNDGRHGLGPEGYRRTYYEALDVIISDINSRFDHATLSIPKAIKAMLLRAANEKATEIDAQSLELYKNDVDVSDLTYQLHMLHDFISKVQQDKNIEIQRIDTIESLADVFKAGGNLSRFFRSVSTLTKIFLTLPISTASEKDRFQHFVD